MKKILIVLFILKLLGCNLNNSKLNEINGYVHYNGSPIEGLRVELNLVETTILNGKTTTYISPVWEDDSETYYGETVHGITDNNGKFIIDTKYLDKKNTYKLIVQESSYYGEVEISRNYTNLELLVFKTDIIFNIPHEVKYSNDTKPVFSWENYPNADYYSLYISGNFDDKHSVLHEKKILNTDYHVPRDLSFNTLYMIRVEAYSSNSDLLAMSIYPFSLQEPLIRNSFQGKVTWADKPLKDIKVLVTDDDFNHYEAVTDSNGKYIITSDNFINDIFYNIKVVNDGSFYDDDLEHNIRYKSLGTEINFNVIKNDLDVFFPIENSIITNSKPIFQWKDYDEVDYYSIILCGNISDKENSESYSTLESEFYIDELKDNFYVHNNKLPNNQYRLLIHGYDEFSEMILTREIYFEIKE